MNSLVIYKIGENIIFTLMLQRTLEPSIEFGNWVVWLLKITFK